MRAYGLFDKDEEQICDDLFKVHGENFALVVEVLEIFESHLIRTSGKIKTNQHPQITITHFIGQNLKFINKAYLELTKGYIRIPSSLLKIVIEQLLYSLVFAEFGELETEYLTLGHYKFARKYPKNLLLSKVDNFSLLFKAGKPAFWNDVLEKEMYSQLNELSHPTPDNIFGLTFDSANQTFTYGPKVQKEILVRAVTRWILLCLVFSLIILDQVFNLDRPNGEIATLKRTTDKITSILQEII